MKSLSDTLAATTGGRVAVRLQLEGEDGTAGGAAAPDGEASSNKSVVPAFRFERKGLAFDEYHVHGDAPFEEELAKRVEAALSLSEPEDAGELWCVALNGTAFGCD